MVRHILVIEHCEDSLSEWLYLEYNHSAKIWDGDIVFTNVHDKITKRRLGKLGMVEEKKAKELYPKDRSIVLDPQADSPLTIKDFKRYRYFIVGGILGYETPKGRTRLLISKDSGFTTRHLGSVQLSIDGAVFMVKAVSLGLKLDDIEVAREIEIKHDDVHSTILPFGYPIIDDNPVITPGLIDYIKKIHYK
ncbi:MAG: SAM-dependent methyltransferase [Candidatus Thermoplasmatota archaeon]